MFKKIIRILGGDPNKREIDRYSELIEAINSLEQGYEALSDDELRHRTQEFKQRIALGETLDDLLIEAFAAVREASKRTIGLRHYDVQLIGGIVLHKGKIAEMRTGEGKTLVATLPIYLNAITGKGVHLVTVNDYLARRDARWMAPIYMALGLSIGVLQIAARTENGKKAYLVDLNRESPHEDQNQLVMVSRADAYSADITYGTNSEFGFDYLRDNMTMRLDERVQRGHNFAIVDEVDNVLIDEARTPLIISGPAEDESAWYIKMAQVAKQLRPDDIEINEKNRIANLTEIGETHVEEILGTPLRDPDRPEDLTPDQANVLGYLEQALRAQYLFRKNKDYLVQSGKVVIVDEFTGRLMPGRRWSEGLHQAIEAKEGVKVEPESVTYATITIQNYFRMYQKLAGMTGTAITEAEEFDKIYKLDALAIPTNLEYQSSKIDTELKEYESVDGKYKYHYYGLKNDPEKSPVYWKRKDFPDIVYRTKEMKLRAITLEILRFHTLGRPVLVGTTSVELSEHLSSRLRAEALRRLSQALILRDNWLKKHNREDEGRQIPELQFLNAPIDELDIPQLRKLARELELSLSLEDPENLSTLKKILNLENQDHTRLIFDLQSGISHQVLNARKHTEESQIITDAGAFGAVTIATNMAGRGVDIKLGGELAEEILFAANRVLKKAGFQDPYDMNMETRQESLLTLDQEAYGIYSAEIAYFLQYLENMGKVRSLGGLHVIGSERHEARRIDNQLRGRAARQGDPGSSRFYLSMEDDLMRLFGGQQADGLMQRLKIDDAIPLEANLVGKIVEQSQNRVEGANFDLRKHLLEYDDVLNNQRSRIYKQRDLIFTKVELSEDVRDMLRTEVSQRVTRSLKNEDGPWELLAWLNDIQPTFIYPGGIYPSYAIRLLVNQVFNNNKGNELNRNDVNSSLLDIIMNSLQYEEDHLIHTLEDLLEKSQERLSEQLSEKNESLDMFFEGLTNPEAIEESRPAELISELQSITGIPIRLTPDQQRQLRKGSKDLQTEIRSQMNGGLTNYAFTRLVGAVERRLDESINIQSTNLNAPDWKEFNQNILFSVREFYKNRKERYIGNGVPGTMAREIETQLEKLPEPITEPDIINILIQIPQGTKTSFDKKTHSKISIQTNRLSFFYYAANLIRNQEIDDISVEVLQHLENGLDALKLAWGTNEWRRLENSTLEELNADTFNLIESKIAESSVENLRSRTFSSLTDDEKRIVIEELGRASLTEIYRQLILSVISQLWVDYLTEMEALRVSSGLEAYAQRDPLVQYKNKAYELFQELLSNVRLGVISRMFTYRPRNINISATSSTRIETPTVSVEVQRPENTKNESPLPSDEGENTAESQDTPGGRSQKRRRHRR